MSETTSNDVPARKSLRRSVPEGWALLATYGTADEGETTAAILETAGIDAQVFGANTNNVDWFWQLFNDVDVIVRKEDLEKAKEITDRTDAPELEPADEPDGEATDENGRPLVRIAAFDNVADMRDAQTILASEKIEAYTPRLVIREKGAAAHGKRFVLRVVESEVEKAKTVLAQEAAEDKDVPRCPKCGSWRVNPVKGFIGEFAGIVGVNPQPKEMTCAACTFRGASGEFLGRG
jgi:hypothetical protein